MADIQITFQSRSPQVSLKSFLEPLFVIFDKVAKLKKLILPVLERAQFAAVVPRTECGVDLDRFHAICEQRCKRGESYYD